MRKFFLFSAFILCFICAGFLKEDLSSYSGLSFKDYTQQSYFNNDATLLYGQTISANIKDFDLQNFLSSMQAKIKDEQTLCDRCVIYAYSSNLSKFVYVNGQKVNLQISLDNDRAYVGYPLIIGSF